MMTLLMGSANGMVLHRAAIRCFQEAGSANPLETAAIWEHLVFLQEKQGEWVILPLSEVRSTLFIPERTFQRLTAWLEKNKYLTKRRKIAAYNGETANWTQYSPNLSTLSDALGCGVFEHADLARSEHADLARSKPRDLACSTSISRKKKEREKERDLSAGADEAQEGKKSPSLASQLLEVWNEQRGNLPKAQMTARREIQLSKVAAQFGQGAAARFRCAVQEVARDSFWTKNKYGLDNLLAGEKYVGKAEAWLEKNPYELTPPAAPSEFGPSITDLIPARGPHAHDLTETGLK